DGIDSQRPLPAHPRSRKREAVQIAELEKENVGKQPDDVAVERGDGQPIEARGRRRSDDDVHRCASAENLSNAAMRYRPCTNLPYGSVRNSPSTKPKWTSSSPGIAECSRRTSSSKPVALVMNNMSMNDTSSGACFGSPSSGSRCVR